MVKFTCNECLDLGYVMPNRERPCPDCRAEDYLEWKRERNVCAPCPAGCECGKHGGVNTVSNEPFRERMLFLEKRGVTAYDIAQKIGLVRADGRGDTTGLKRKLGMKAHSSGKIKANGERYTTVRKTIDVDLAVELCDAMGIDYTEVGV